MRRNKTKRTKVKLQQDEVAIMGVVTAHDMPVSPRFAAALLNMSEETLGEYASRNLIRRFKSKAGGFYYTMNDIKNFALGHNEFEKGGQAQ